MGLEEVVPALFLILILVLVLPGFLRTNTKFSQFIKNLFIWSIVIITVMFIAYLFFNKI